VPPVKLFIIPFVFYFHSRRGIFNRYLLHATSFERSSRHLRSQFYFIFCTQFYFNF